MVGHVITICRDWATHFESLISISLVNLKIFLGNKWDLLVWSLRTQDISEGDILKSLRLSNIIIIWNVDAGRYSGSSERQDFKTGEIWAKELVLLKILGPWKFGNHRLSAID